MTTKLERLLESIHPDRTIDEVSRRVDRAVNSFQAGFSRITDWKEFEKCIARFMVHLQNHVLRLCKPRQLTEEHMDFDIHQGFLVLHKLFGQNGEKAAFEMVRTGNEGGLYGVLRKIARGTVDKYAGNEIAARIGDYWNNLSTEEKLDAPNEYLKKYGHLLPSELTEGSAGRIRAFFPKVLEEHPKIIKGLRRVGRSQGSL